MIFPRVLSTGFGKQVPKKTQELIKIIKHLICQFVKLRLTKVFVVNFINFTSGAKSLICFFSLSKTALETKIGK